MKFSCSQCEFKATEKGSLFRHSKSKHEGVKFPCGQCDYKATQKGSLSRHIKHEGVKFPCGQCDYKATDKGRLLTHIKLIHKGVKFPCDHWKLEILEVPKELLLLGFGPRRISASGIKKNQ